MISLTNIKEQVKKKIKLKGAEDLFYKLFKGKKITLDDIRIAVQGSTSKFKLENFGIFDPQYGENIDKNIIDFLKKLNGHKYILIESEESVESYNYSLNSVIINDNDFANLRNELIDNFTNLYDEKIKSYVGFTVNDLKEYISLIIFNGSFANIIAIIEK